MIETICPTTIIVNYINFPYNINMIISPCISICKTDPKQDIVMVVEEIMKKKKFGNLKKQLMNGKKKY